MKDKLKLKGACVLKSACVSFMGSEFSRLSLTFSGSMSGERKNEGVSVCADAVGISIGAL